MSENINLSIQVLPMGMNKPDAYAIVDKAIETIAASGMKYQVCPFETVIEGPYDEVMQLVDRVRTVCHNAGSDDMLIYIKMQTSRVRDVRIDDKMEQYR